MDEKLHQMAVEAREEHIPVAVDATALFLTNFCVEHKPKNILEVGTAIGYSGTIMLLNSGDESMLTTIEIDETSFLKSRETFKRYNIEPRVMGYLGDAKEILPWLEDEYDLIFLDGPKAQYIRYLPILMKLLKVGGHIIADNIYFMNLVKGDAEAPRKHRSIVNNLRKYNAEVASNENLETTFYDTGDGIAVSKRIK